MRTPEHRTCYTEAEIDALVDKATAALRAEVDRLSGENAALKKHIAERSRAYSSDWGDEDENGRYLNRCCSCDCEFIGHKRRVTCVQCGEKGSEMLINGLTAQVAAEAGKVAQMRADTIDACIAISRGCTDYGGGYGGGRERHIFHHGMGTVTNCLEAFKERGLADLQLRVVHSIGVSEAERKAGG